MATNTPAETKRIEVEMLLWANLTNSRPRAHAHHLTHNLGYNPADAFAEVALLEAAAGRRLIGPRKPTN